MKPEQVRNVVASGPGTTATLSPAATSRRSDERDSEGTTRVRRDPYLLRRPGYAPNRTDDFIRAFAPIDPRVEAPASAAIYALCWRVRSNPWLNLGGARDAASRTRVWELLVNGVGAQELYRVREWKIYVGSTGVGVLDRLNSHRRKARLADPKSSVCKAWRAYGEPDMAYIAGVVPVARRYEFETAWIEWFGGLGEVLNERRPPGAGNPGMVANPKQAMALLTYGIRPPTPDAEHAR